MKDYEESVIVGNELENLIEYGPLVIPGDVPQSVNDAYMWATALKRSTKWVSGQIFNLDTIPYIKEMCVVAAGSEKGIDRILGKCIKNNVSGGGSNLTKQAF